MFYFVFTKVGRDMKKFLFPSILVLLVLLFGSNQTLQAQDYYKGKEAPTNQLVEKNFPIGGKFIGTKENTDGTITYYFSTGIHIHSTTLTRLDTEIWLFRKTNGEIGILEKK